MTTVLGNMASRAFKLDTLEILEASFGKIRGSKPWIMGTMVVPSYIEGEAGPMTVGNARTRGVNPSMAGGTRPFFESDDLRFMGVSKISSMTTKEGGAEATWPRCFSKYSS